MSALPPNPYGHENEAWQRAYDVCLGLEARSQNTQSQLIRARFLGYMILEAPTTSGRDNVCRELTACANDQQLEEMGDLYISHLLRCCKCSISNFAF
jgi:hypothetical protein